MTSLLQASGASFCGFTSLVILETDAADTEKENRLHEKIQAKPMMNSFVRMLFLLICICTIFTSFHRFVGILQKEYFAKQRCLYSFLETYNNFILYMLIIQVNQKIKNITFIFRDK